MDTISWRALEFENHKKSGSWYAALWIVAAALVVVAILTKSLFMAIFVILAALVISIFAAKEPREIYFSLSETTITIDKKPHALEGFQSFWIFEREEVNILSLAPDNIRPHIKVDLPKEITSDVRLFLRAAIEEEEHEESLVDNLADWLRF